MILATNSGGGGGGGMFIGQGSGGEPSNPILKNVIIANSSSGGDCVLGSTINTSSSNNLIESTGAHACGLTNGANGNIIGSDPNLGTLTGSPAYFPLNTGSPANNAGTNTGCPSTDQRGVMRPQNGFCDIGAYESYAQSSPALVVNTDEDSTDGFCDAYLAGVNDCTLREAITYANSIGGSDTITFAANYTITLGSQLPAVTGTIIINGNGTANTIIQANATPDTATYRVFEVGATGDLTLNSLTIRHGRCNGSCNTSSNVGGGIYNNAGTLAINNSLITANTAPNDQAGGLYNDGGTVTINSSTFSNNSSVNAGAAIANANGPMIISNSTIANNSATSNTAGGIYNTGTMDIYNSTISGNTSNGTWDGDNIYNSSGTLIYTIRSSLIAQHMVIVALLVVRSKQ